MLAKTEHDIVKVVEVPCRFEMTLTCDMCIWMYLVISFGGGVKHLGSWRFLMFLGIYLLLPGKGSCAKGAQEASSTVKAVSRDAAGCSSLRAEGIQRRLS